MTFSKLDILRLACTKAMPPGGGEINPGNPFWGPRLKAFHDAVHPSDVIELLDAVESVRAENQRLRAHLEAPLPPCGDRDHRDLHLRYNTIRDCDRKHRARLALLEPLFEAAKAWRETPAVTDDMSTAPWVRAYTNLEKAIDGALAAEKANG